MRRQRWLIVATLALVLGGGLIVAILALVKS